MPTLEAIVCPPTSGRGQVSFEAQKVFLVLQNTTCCLLRKTIPDADCASITCAFKNRFSFCRNMPRKIFCKDSVCFERLSICRGGQMPSKEIIVRFLHILCRKFEIRKYERFSKRKNDFQTIREFFMIDGLVFFPLNWKQEILKYCFQNFKFKNGIEIYF